MSEDHRNDTQWLLFVDRVMDTVDKVVSQFTSGRWLLTIAAGVCLIHYAWALPVEKQDKIIDLIKDIVIFYFVVREAAKTGGTNGKTDTNGTPPSTGG